MTRINSHINPKYLTDEHLLAEHREIKRIPACLNKSLQHNDNLVIPANFCLGTGHVKFFYNKFNYLIKRYALLHNECLNRQFNVTDYSNNFSIADKKYYQDYLANAHDNEIIKNRIIEKIRSSNKGVFHYYGKAITKDEAIQILTEN